LDGGGVALVEDFDIEVRTGHGQIDPHHGEYDRLADAMAVAGRGRLADAILVRAL
jgi:hypothetical protein